MAGNLMWEAELRKKLFDVLTASFDGNNSLSGELKSYAIKNHLLEDITNFIQKEYELFDQKIRICKETDLQDTINEIVARKNYFFIGWMKDISHQLWKIKPTAETSSKWQAYKSKHKEEGEKVQTFYAHVQTKSQERMKSLVESNMGNTFSLNSGGTGNHMANGYGSSENGKGIIFILEYSKISYNVLIAGDCLLNGIKARHLHEIHKAEVVVYPRATSADLFKNYTKKLTKSTADVLILHFGTYDFTLSKQKDTIENMRNFVQKIREKCPRLTIVISSIIVRVDKKGIRASVKNINTQLKALCAEEQIDFINNDNITEELLCQKMLLTLNADGKNTLAQNMSTYINNIL